ncbi:unnamed protein product [Ranitomeya imitator]|uniref:DENN/MADD domain containing 4A n=1 Tax=Ranitomeya imitator TaxID=111125 RepID=A0ABN9LZS0_9NEOB|nr:unnamed protein product [Ranitomeya imitator]
MMEERPPKLVDYFVVAGLTSTSRPLEEENRQRPARPAELITDVAVIIRSQAEEVPHGFTCIEKTPGGHTADLSSSFISNQQMYLCYRRSRDKTPITELGVHYEGKEMLRPSFQVIDTTPYSHSANLSSGAPQPSKDLPHLQAGTRIPGAEHAGRHGHLHHQSQQGGQHSAYILQGGPEPEHQHVWAGSVSLLQKGDGQGAQPGVISRFPETDSEMFSFPELVPIFCLPMGATIESWSLSTKYHLPVFSTFVLTGAFMGLRSSFMSRTPGRELSEKQCQRLGLLSVVDKRPVSSKSVQTKKSICVLSRWPMFDVFQKFLTFIYRYSHLGTPCASHREVSKTINMEECSMRSTRGGQYRSVICQFAQHSDRSPICLRALQRYQVPALSRHLDPDPRPSWIRDLLQGGRHISNFMFNVPFPSPQRPRILIQMSPYDNVLLCQPVSSPLPLSGASYVTFLQNLGPENSVTLLLAVLTEQKLLIHSQRPDVLTSVGEALVSIIFPLRWQCPYIPLCPLSLSDVLCAPVPFIVGIHSSYFDLHDPPPDVLCVDLDTNTLFQCYLGNPAKVLRSCLSDLHKQLDEMYNKPMEEASLEFLLKDYDLIYGRRTQLELDVRASFLRFMACLFKGYRSYLLPITQAPSECTRDSSNLFNLEGFRKSRDRAHQKFSAQMVKTQMFMQFIEDCSFVSDRQASLEFFDNCVEKMEDLHLVELDESHRSEHTVFIMPAEEPMDLNGSEPLARYKYESFPALQRDLCELQQDSLMAPLSQLKTSAPSSPAPRRTKQEIKSAQRVAHIYSSMPEMWAKCLLGHCYGLWFIYLPTFVRVTVCKVRALQTAYDALKQMETKNVCYRILMQLCGQYGEPVLAVRVMLEMRKAGIVPNAITYGYYNKVHDVGVTPDVVSSDM